MIQSSSFISIYDRSGEIRKVWALSLLDRDYYAYLSSQAQQMAAGNRIADLLDNDPLFLAIVDALLKLVGLSPAWVDPELIVKLFFGTDEAPPVVFALNFPPQKKQDDEESKEEAPDLSAYDQTAWAIALLWRVTDSPITAFRLARSEPWALLSAVLECRQKQQQLSDPEYKAKQKQKDNLASVNETLQSGIMQQIIAGIESGEMPDGISPSSFSSIQPKA